MTIRFRLMLSFLSILVLFGVSLLIYFVSNNRRSAALEDLSRAVSRQILVASIDGNLRDLQKQVALLGQVMAETTASGLGSTQISQFEGQLEGVRKQIQQLRDLSDSAERIKAESFGKAYEELSQSWRTFYRNFGVNQAIAIIELASRAEPLSQRMQQLVPQLQEEEKHRVEAARATFYSVELLATQITLLNFIISTIVAVGVAYLVSRYFARSLDELRMGANLIGAGNLDHRIAVKSSDELGDLAHAFNAMTQNLLSARHQLTQANEELERRNWEVEQQRVALADVSKNMKQLYRLSTAMQEPLSLKEHISRVLESARRVVVIDRFYTWVLSPECDRLTILAGAGISDEDWKEVQGLEVPLADVGTLHKAYQDGVPMAFDELNPVPVELRLKPPYSELKGLRTKNFLVVPMIARGRTVGMLTADNKRTHQSIFPHTVDLLQIFASNAAVAIENARLFQEIEQKGQQLEAASKHKSQFLANMSHELRTPLNAILGYTELVLDSIYGDVPEKVREIMAHVGKAGHHLLGLINDVLDLSKIEAGHLMLCLDDYSMTEVVQTVVTSMQSLAAEKGLVLWFEMSAELPLGKGDERRITQVLLNLVGNAIKFTDSGDVCVRVTASDGEFNVSISDTGPGISEADQERIFEEFQQADSSSTKTKGGTGLGLSIARKIIEMHGGRIGVDSSPERGSTFRFSLPVRAERRAEVA